MALVEIDHVLATMEKELGVCVTLGRHPEALGVYGVMVRLALIHTLKPETLRMIFKQLSILPEGYKHAENIMALANDKERMNIEMCRMVSQTLGKASRTARNALPPLLS